MAGKTAILAVDIVADARDAQKGFDAAGDSAKKASERIDDVGGRAGDTSTAFSALSGALAASGFGPFAAGLDVASIALDAAEGSTILFRVAQESLSLSTIKDTAAKALNTAQTIASTAASMAAAAAARVWAGVQAVLNAVLTANPIGLIILAIVALITVIVLIATKTTWFQDIWTAVWGTVQKVAGAVWEWIVNKATWAWNLLVAGVRLYIGIYVAIFEGIKTAIGAVWDWLKDTGTAALDALLNPVDAFAAAWDAVVDAIKSVIDWIGRLKVPSWLSDLGGVVGGLFSAGRSAAPGAGVRTVGGSSGAAAPSLFSTASGGSRASAAPTGTVVNVYVPESSDPVATARYLKRIMRRGQAAGVPFGTV